MAASGLGVEVSQLCCDPLLQEAEVHAAILMLRIKAK